MKKTLFAIILLVTLASCGDKSSKQTNSNKTSASAKIVRAIPAFNADSAYRFVAKQISFGPRVPGSQAHEDAAQWLVGKLSDFSDTVIVQNFRTRLYNNKGIDGQNIIATFNPEAKKRIVLAAHWDSRPYADHDADQSNWSKPIDGANDGASGVGVLIEMARIFKNHPLTQNIGVDIVFFDLEDYGPPQQESEKYYSEHNHWALGSQYWSKQPHVPGYQAYYGILLDMVGGANPNFMKEYYSQQYAAWLSNKVWRLAYDLGYRGYFSNELGDPISDDHLPMNELAGIPTIDIIDLNQNSTNGSFPDTWHTLNDNISNIDPNTLEMVGTVITNLIYNE
jgi:Predicted aminopeptidases